MARGTTETRPHASWLGLAVALSIVAAVVGGILWFGGYLERPRHIGTFTSTGPTLGDWTMDVDECEAGGRKNFNGVQLYSSKDKHLAIWMVEDPLRGLVPSVDSTTQHQSINVDAASCSVLTGHAYATTTTLRPPTPMAGEYTLDCTVDQSHLTGHVEFKQCL